MKTLACTLSLCLLAALAACCSEPVEHEAVQDSQALEQRGEVRYYVIGDA